MENTDWLPKKETTELVQRSSQWHETRRKYIGASEIGILLGENEWSTPYELWLLKTGQKEPFKGNWATQRGIDAEPHIRRLYEEKYQTHLTTPVLCEGNLIASLDGLTPEGVVVEFKYPSAAKHNQAVKGEVPSCYVAQVQQQMLLAKARLAHYVSYDGKDIAVVEVHADDALQFRIIEVAAAFWRYVETRTPPPTDEVKIDDQSVESVLARIVEIDEITSPLLKEQKELKDSIREKQEGTYGPYKIVKTERIGAINYKSIGVLKGMDLEQYRGLPTTSVSVKRV